MKRLRLLPMLVALCAGSAFAQSAACPTLVRQALAQASDQCSGLARNSACYGSVRVDATLRQDASEAPFAVPGDTLGVADLETLAAGPMVTPEEWGIALLSLQANLPGTLPGQNVTVVLVGDTQIDAIQRPRADPAEDAETLHPMQAFTLRNGIGAPQCAEAPPDGMLVQTPEGAAVVDLTVNGVQVALGSTVFVRAAWGGDWSLATLEGSATVTLDSVTVEVPAGTQAVIPLDDAGQPAGPPVVSAYDQDGLAALVPVIEALMPAPVDIAPVVTPTPDGAAAVSLGGSIVSPAQGEACVAGGVTWVIDMSAAGPGTIVQTVYPGGFVQVSAGTTARLSVPDDANSIDPDGFPYGSPGSFVWVILVDGSDYGQLLYESGAERSIVYSFEQDGTYALAVSGLAGNPARAELSILCSAE